MLKRVYVEITNICNLRCDFCPGTRREGRFLSAEEHVMGEPLLHPELGTLLAIAGEEGFRACLTTNGTLLEEKTDLLLAAPALHKLSVSLHSAEGNGLEKLGDYLAGVWESALTLSRTGVICALRLWNIGGAEERNGEIYAFLEKKLGVHPLELPRPRQGSWRLGERLYLERAEKFDWPDLDAAETGTRFGLGLRDQAAVLCDGTVVPC